MYFTFMMHLRLDWPHFKCSAPHGASGCYSAGAALGGWQVLIEDFKKVLQEHFV